MEEDVAPKLELETVSPILGSIDALMPILEMFGYTNKDDDWYPFYSCNFSDGISLTGYKNKITGKVKFEASLASDDILESRGCSHEKICYAFSVGSAMERKIIYARKSIGMPDEDYNVFNPPPRQYNKPKNGLSLLWAYLKSVYKLF